LQRHIKDVCYRFAKLGYFVPEPFARQGDMSKGAALDEARAVAGKVPGQQVLSDLDAMGQWAKGNRGAGHTCVSAGAHLENRAAKLVGSGLA
jgi:dienelactone hydrolase